MMKYRLFFTGFALLYLLPSWGQVINEREFRIKKSDFPKMAYELIQKEVEAARRMRFYKEIDSSIVFFKAKFKKDRLYYSLEFNALGELENIKLKIERVDMPEEVYEAISEYLGRECPQFKIRGLYQQYPVSDGLGIDKVIRHAFQNLILPHIEYELITSCRLDKGREEFEYLFGAGGNFLSRRISLPPNYDHVLY